MNIVKLNEYEFDKFSKTHKYHSYYQTSSYAKLMEKSGLKPLYLGFYDNNNMVGATLILAKNVLMGFKYGYAPRGLLIDYEKFSQLTEITMELKNYLFKDRYILLKIDPLIVINEKDKKGNILYSYNNLDNLINKLNDIGYHHCGFNQFFESIKPRWNASIDLSEDINTAYKKYNKQIRTKIRKANKFGVTAYKDNNAIDKIYSFIEKNGTYSIDYYYNLRKEFGDDIEVYVTNLNTSVYVEGSRLLYEKELEYNDYLNNIISRDNYKGKNMKDILNKKMESDKMLVSYKNYMIKATDLFKEYPEGLIIGGAVLIKDNDILRLLIEGYDHDYGNLCPLYLLKWEIIKEYNQSQYKEFDLNAIVGDHDKNNPYYGLNEAKLGYNAVSREYIGEFNLIINNPMYALYKSIQANDSFKDIKK